MQVGTGPQREAAHELWPSNIFMRPCNMKIKAVSGLGSVWE